MGFGGPGKTSRACLIVIITEVRNRKGAESGLSVGRSSQISRVHTRSGTLGTGRAHRVLIDELHSGGVSCYFHTDYDVAEWMCIFG